MVHTDGHPAERGILGCWFLKVTPVVAKRAVTTSAVVGLERETFLLTFVGGLLLEAVGLIFSVGASDIWTAAALLLPTDFQELDIDTPKIKQRFSYIDVEYGAH